MYYEFIWPQKTHEAWLAGELFSKPKSETIYLMVVAIDTKYVCTSYKVYILTEKHKFYAVLPSAWYFL